MRPGSQYGFTYLGVLFAVALIGIGLAVVAEMWQTTRAREREGELLWVGEQYRKAINAYYRQPAAPGRYPQRLEDLLADPRSPSPARYLRALYPDPVTQRPEWGLVMAPEGGIAGVYSLSDAKPLKTSGFRLHHAGFEDAEKHSEWKFVATTAAPLPRRR